MLDSLAQQPLTFFLRALAEIFLLTYGFYRLILVIRGTRAAPVALGVGVLGVVYVLAGFLGLENVRWLLSSIGTYWIIALIVIFQPEIRAALLQITLHLFAPRRLTGVRKHEYEDVIFAVGQLSQARIGALIVLERETGLRTFIQSGVALDARLSSDLLVSIFQRRSPLHDGAVIVQRGRIAAAACFLPLTTNPGLSSSLGTRHRAAIGVTEESDCVTIAISEITGRVSVATSGNIEMGVSLDRVRELLYEYFGPAVSRPSPEREEPIEALSAGSTAAVTESRRLAEPPESLAIHKTSHGRDS